MPPGVSGEALAEETEAFLSGHLAELLEVEGRPVPLWAWVNLLAHGRQADLAAAREERTPGRFYGFATMRGELAGELLDLVAGPAELEELQRSLLVPFELDLASRASLLIWGAPRLRAAVDEVLSGRRHGEVA